ncbi:hypothetical protein D3C72_1517840 [compost metagenome]
MIELTVPIFWRALKSWSLETALTMSWASSNTPSMARLKMFGSCRLNICAVWNALILRCGLSMNTRMPSLPRIAYSAALPVSPEVAPRMFSFRPARRSAYSNRLPSSCIAMSLKASVGPLDRPSSCSLVPPSSPSVRSGVMSAVLSPSRALQYTSGV